MRIAGLLFKGVALALLVLGAQKARQIYLQSREEFEKVQEPNYIPPEPNLKVVRGMSRATIAWQVGNIRVIGRENIDQFGDNQPLVVLANHSSYADCAVITTAIRRKTFWLAAVGILKFAGGLGGYLLKDWGMVPVEVLRKREEQELWRFSRLLEQGKTLAVCPEGWVHLDGVTREFKKGIVYIVREAEERLGRPVDIVPLFVRYSKYPNDRITRLGVPLDFLVTFITGPLYRGEATVTIGEPIKSSSLPKDASAAIELLREKVVELNSDRTQVATI